MINEMLRPYRIKILELAVIKLYGREPGASPTLFAEFDSGVLEVEHFHAVGTVAPEAIVYSLHFERRGLYIHFT